MVFSLQKDRLEHLSTFGNQLGDESDKYVSSSAATTVVRKTVPNRTEHRSSNSSDGTFRRHSVEPNRQVLANKYAVERTHPRPTLRATSIGSPLSFGQCNPNYSGQQILITSGDIEAMTMKQFQVGSLGC